jgi:hemerythrin
MELQWQDSMSVGVTILDDQHKKFIEILNILISKVSDSQESIKTTFQGIDDYIKFHFQTEEDFFNKYNYPDTEDHKKAHTDFIQKIASIREKFITDPISSKFELVDFLENWLIDHIQNKDKKYTEFFHQNGLH